MFIGQHTHKLDEKSRLSVPKKFREKLGGSVVVTHGLDQCLFVYTLEEWEQFSHKMSELSVGQADTRAFTRFMLSSAVEVDIDKSGRGLIPDVLRDSAGLLDTVIVAGVHNRIELWNEQSWREYIGAVTKRADTLAERLGDIGML